MGSSPAPARARRTTSVLLDAGVMNQLAFKGGTCLRKLVFGSSGRFSADLDFTLDGGGRGR